MSGFHSNSFAEQCSYLVQLSESWQATVVKVRESSGGTDDAIKKVSKGIARGESRSTRELSLSLSFACSKTNYELTVY
jgi:hypothetical protein